MSALLSDSPIARNTDPVTSHLAAKDITASGVRSEQQRQVLELVRRYPHYTSRELSQTPFNQQHYKLDRWDIARRLPELREANLIQMDEGKRPCNITRKAAMTWVAVPQQEKLAL